MARGPFQGSFQPNLRPTVVTAPDALVYINGGLEIAGCPDCSRVFDLNKYITSITVDLNVDSVPGSASVQMAIPRHTIDDFYFDGTPIISPMMEIEIYAKGYYTLEGIPQYYPIFWGLTTEVNDNYSAGAHTVSINCSDILKWWELCKMNMNPALTSPGGKSLSLFQNAFSGMNPFDIIFSLAEQSFGDVIVGSGSLVTSYREQNTPSTFDVALSDLCLYWQKRFSRIRNGLLLYGTNGVAIRGDTLESTFQRLKGPSGLAPAGWVANAVRVGNGGPDQGQMGYDPTSAGVVAFRNNYSNIGVNLWQTEFQTKLELAQAAKESIGYEFFMDVDGSIVFKPPFYNLDVLSNKPQSWIQDIDIIDWDFSESEAEVITQVIMQGSFAGAIDLGVGAELTPFSSVTDYHLLRKYGWRSQTYNSEFLADPQLMFYQGLDLLDRYNSRRFRGTVTIPMRPELRLGFPVYVAPKDEIWYVTGISHNIAFGGRATTTLTMTAKRKKFIALQGTASLALNNMTAGPNPAQANVTAGTTASGPGNSQSVGDPLPSTAFPYSSRQLSAQANFTLNLGTNPAYLPAINTDSQAVATPNPYDPVITYHPTTGRIMGAPNIVMVYTGSFASAAGSSDNLNSNLGQHDAGTNSAIQKSQQSKVTNTQQIAYANRSAVQLDSSAEMLREKYIVNRYTYGLSSAGRFIYAYDKGGPGTANSTGVIGEMLTIATSQVPTSGTATDPPGSLFTKGSTCLIRPVSDERGFEVVGHFKYGRRVSLRDGSLVLSGNTNSAANIDMQLALGGNLYSVLTSQSQGLTAIQSAYPNPAVAVTTLQPTDLQTSAVVSPDTQTQMSNTTGNQLLGPSGYNAIGMPQQAGSPVSVEATQFSKALTLAEMDIQPQGWDPADANEQSCPCMLSRSDLAFLNVGYNVAGTQVTGTATPDLTSLGNTVPGAPVTATLGTTANPSPLQQSLNAQITTIQNLQTQLDAVQARADMLDSSTNPLGWSAAQQSISTLQAQINRAMAVQDDIEEEIETNTMAPNTGTGSDGTVPAPSPGSVLSKAETFLSNLYQILDGPHQQLEQTLRGNLQPGGATAQPANYLNTGATSAPSLAAPFSPTTAGALGNPAAAALTASSAVSDLSQTWASFGSQLASTAQRTQLQGQIQAQMAQAISIQNQIAALQTQSSNQGSSVVVTGTSGQTAAQAITALEQQLAMLQQQIANNQGQLAALPAPVTTP